MGKCLCLVPAQDKNYTGIIQTVESLNRKLKREGKIQAKEVINYGIQLAKVLSYLHNRPTPIIYRDMKPDNVMLTPDGRIKLIDFGLCMKMKKRSKWTCGGTPEYLPPEIINHSSFDQSLHEKQD